MLRFDLEGQRFEPLLETQLRDQKVPERYDLQRAIVNSWDLFKNEIGLPNCFFAGEEVNRDGKSSSPLLTPATLKLQL